MADARREVTMRRLTLALFALTLLFLLASSPSFALAQGQGIFSESGYDFKGIPRYTQPRHSFVFTNNSSEDLRLLGARVSCQCTKVFIPEKRVYKQGEKGEVVAQIDGVRFTGVRHVTVTVTFQRGSSVFEIPLNIAGVIIENVSLEPQELTFLVDQEMKRQDGEAGVKALQLSADSTSRTKQARVVYPGYNETVARVSSSSPYLEIKTGKPVRVGSGTQTPLFVTVKDNAPAGYLNATVQVWSNGASGGTPLVLSVSGVVRAPLTVSPSALTFFTSKEGQKITKNFVVSAPSEFTLKSVYSPTKALDCKFSQKAIRPAKVCVVPVTFDPQKLSDADDNPKLKIETTDGRVLFLDVQISSGNFDAEILSAMETKRKNKEGSVDDPKVDIVDGQGTENEIMEEESTKGVVATQESESEASGFARSGVDATSVSSTPSMERKSEKRRDSAPMTIPATRSPRSSGVHSTENLSTSPFSLLTPRRLYR